MLNGGGEDDGNTRRSSVECEGGGTELCDTDRGEADEAGVEEEGIHQCAGGLHGVNREQNGDAESEGKVTLNDANLEPEGEDAEKDDAEEGPHAVHGGEPGIQETVHAKDGVEEGVNDPDDGEDTTKNGKHEIRPIPQDTDTVGFVGLHGLVPLFFEHVDFIAPVVVDGPTGIFTTIFHTVFNQRIAHLTNQDFAVLKFHVIDGFGTQTPSREKVVRRSHHTDTTKDREEETTKEGQNGDKV